MNYLYKISELIVTGCYIGKIKFAPGTFGSFLAFPICYIIMHFTLRNQVIFQISGLNQYEQIFLSVFFLEVFIAAILFIIGVYFTGIYINHAGKEDDPKEVVIDEIVGQMLTIILSSFSIIFLTSSSLAIKIDEIYLDIIFLFLLPFGLFRLFDIAKPWPINWLDANIKGASGVMIDDVAAAFFAVIFQYVIVFFILEFFPIN